MNLGTVQAALATTLVSRRNQLRKLGAAELRARPAVAAETAPFRDMTVCLGIATAADAEGGVTVLMRAFVSPYLTSRCVQWEGFRKTASGGWSLSLPDDAAEELKARIERELPMV